METRSAWWRRLSLAVVIASLTCGTAWRATVAEEPLVSVVADSAPRPAASHGLGKLLAALKAKGVSHETAVSLADARGKVLVVAGLAAGDGPAAQLLKAGNQPHSPRARGAA